jgi:hypothetical protein
MAEHATKRGLSPESLTESRLKCVRGWRGLDASHKLGWEFLWFRAGQRPGTITVHTSEIGLDQGAADTDKPGRKALQALQVAGLIEVIAREGGRWTVYVLDPVELRDARLKLSAPPDPQQELFGNQLGETAGDLAADSVSDVAGEIASQAQPPMPLSDAPKPPTQKSALGDLAGDIAAAPCTKQSTITITDDNPINAPPRAQLQDKASGETAGDIASRAQKLPTRAEQIARQTAQRQAQDADPASAKQAVRQFFEQSRKSAAEEIRDLEAKITLTVADPGLYEGVIARTARAAAANPAFCRELLGLLDAIRTKFGRDPTRAADRGRYFNVSLARARKRHGVTD